MLRRIDSAHIEHEPHWLTGRADLWLLTGRQRLQVGRRISARRVKELDRQQRSRPVAYRAQSDPRTFWRFQNRWFVDRDDLDADEVQALLVTRERRRLATVSRAQAQVHGTEVASQGAVRVRGYVSDEVKQFIWTRDEGRCAQCGSDSELQYDHVIPVALGGSSDAENLQILCGPCNRRKGVDVVVG